MDEISTLRSIFKFCDKVVLQPLQDKRVVVGQNVLLECQVEGRPDPVVKWLKDDHDVTQCPDYEVCQAEISISFPSLISLIQMTDLL